MTNPSNLYAEHIFANQPISLWALDDKMDYLSYIDEDFRNMSDNWTSSIEDTTISLEDKDSSPASKMQDVGKYKIQVGYGEETKVITLVSDQTFTSADESIVSGLYIQGTSVSSYNARIGFKVGEETTFVDEFPAQLSVNKWSFVSATFSTDEPISASLVVQIAYEDPASSLEDPTFYINGLTVGLRSEEFFKVSPGIQGEIFNILGINISPDDVVLAASYGKQYGTDSGLYFIKDNNILAKNSTIPMVYGAANSTIITPNTNGEPSMIVPAHGFMNENGRSTKKTLEMWLRINSKTTSGAYRKIVGPLKSANGIYVDGPHMLVKYGNYTMSHYVGEWFRPMLVDLSISDSAMTLMINGALVAGTNIDRDNLEFVESPARTVVDDVIKSQDFIGFYAYPDVPTLEVDAVAIYPYMISEDLAKRNFTYGQAVAYPQDINVAYDGKSFFVDYPSAEYSRNHAYPDPGRWEQGVYDNILITNNILSSPEYTLPQYFSSDNSTITSLMQDCYDSESESQFISLRPKESWESVNSYLLFNSFRAIYDRNDLIFGVFEGGDQVLQEQILFKIQNNGNEYVKVSITDSLVSYYFKQNGFEETLISETASFDISGSDYNGKFLAGVNVQQLYESSSSLAKFFSSPESLKVFLGGDYSGTEEVLSNTYQGKIHSFSFASTKDAARYSDYVSEGILSGDESVFEEVLGDVSSYTLVHKREVDRSKIDIFTKSYWDDSLSLSYMGSKKDDGSGNLESSLDYIQINLNYPAPRIFDGEEVDSSGEDVRSYVSFQYMNSGLHEDISSFSRYPIPKNGLVVPGSDWQTSLYEVADGNVIMIPQMEDGESFEMLAMVTHIEFVSRGTTKPIKIRSLQYASRASERTSTDINSPKNGIGSRFGEYAYPYSYDGTESDFTSSSPVSIYKGSTPYLYLTGNSGLSMVGDYDENVNRGFLLPINKESEEQFNISSIQFAMLWKDSLFPESGSPQEIFEIAGSSAQIKFYIESIDAERTRAKIYARSGTSNYSALSYFWNGNSVQNPIAVIDEWGMLGIIFDPFISFEGSPGSLRFKSPMVVNNFSFYQLSEIAQTQQIVKNFWVQVLGVGSNNFWQEYQSMTWKEVLYQTATVTAPIDPSEVYQVYLGTNKTIADANEGSNMLRFKDYQYVTYIGTSWDRITEDPL